MCLWHRTRPGRTLSGRSSGDRGVRCRAIRYTDRLTGTDAAACVDKGDWDNVMAEAFNSLLKAEPIHNPLMRGSGLAVD